MHDLLPGPEREALVPLELPIRELLRYELVRLGRLMHGMHATRRGRRNEGAWGRCPHALCRLIDRWIEEVGGAR